MKKILLIAAVITVFHVPAYAFLEKEPFSIQIRDMRFYAVQALQPLPGGGLVLIASGQIRQDNRNAALIIAFSLADGKYKEIAREIFHAESAAKGGKTRIRSLICRKEQARDGFIVIVNGKAGPENREKGFIRSYSFSDTFKLLDSITFSDPDTSYTHGYPLIWADLNGDGSQEIVCGGFSGDNDRDHADIKIYSIRKDGTLSQIKEPYLNRLNTMRLRINALTAGDLNADGLPEVVAAGRTVENDIERAAFLAFSEETQIWKQIETLGTCRYRYATVNDINSDGHLELILGGRIDMGKTCQALLDIWQGDKQAMHLISRYRFTGVGSTRLRIVEPLSESPGLLIIGGRMEVLQDGILKWKGFLQQMAFKSGILAPCSSPVILDKDWETRVRAVDLYENKLIIAGFTEDKNKASSAFISVYPLP